ncbi:Integrin alpha-1 [Ataeniobius toweri]|uniref:Integrin alpha-1 n=1 Tax=Ataeniobius toweri TaxID=208326 RepID=A0ABU7AQI6_9TELE|nr:Integrin alpha-1 [Ataeniobius toweri]
MYMGPERDEQGKVYVYKLNERGSKFVHKFNLKPVNQSCCTAHSDGCIMKNEPCGARFGTAIAAVSDLNLDGFNDVVIGAPFENDHRGAVYIYHGSKDRSLKKDFVQHIPAGGDGDKVKFFGQSIHGIMDLNGDGIIDVTIGGLGGASLFWMLWLGQKIKGRNLNMRSSTDIAALTSPGIVKPAENKVSLPFPACLTGRRNGGAYLKRQKLAGELLLHKAIPGRA